MEVKVSHKCPKCGHPSRPHVFDSNGKTRCPQCPDEVCMSKDKQEIEHFPDVLGFGELTTIGIKPIGEMSDKELIEEIMHAQFVALTSSQFDMQRKRRMVAQIRAHAARARIYREAGVTDEWGSFFDL